MGETDCSYTAWVSMRREELAELNCFVTVAEERNFTRAATRLGTSQSAVSNTIRRLEERTGVRLITRTTRKVVLTEPGERLLESIGPALTFIDRELAALADFRDRPAGMVRVTTSEHAAQTILWPAARRLMKAYPDIRVELSVEAALTDIVDHRFDAGVRLGEHVAKDMIALRIGSDVRMMAVASPAYLRSRARPESPGDLAAHACINIRTPTNGGLYGWEFEKDGREIRVKVEGQFVCNTAPLAVAAAASDLGIAFVPDFHAQEAVDTGNVVPLLEDWCQPFAGYHLYYPSRRQSSTAFSLLLAELRNARP